VLTLAVISPGAEGAPSRSVEHEAIPPDPANDVAFGLRLDGDLPPAIETPSGLVASPDPRAAVSPATPPDTPPTSLAGHDSGPDAASRFTPDTDTARPDHLPYSDPFVPTTAPWKRLVAFDRVDADYSLSVLDTSLHVMPVHEPSRSDREERFYGDLVVNVQPSVPVRIPSVGPGAHVLHARLGVGAEDRDVALFFDGADNWFLSSSQAGPARLVFELSIARAAFGGPFDEALDGPLGTVGVHALPPNVQRDANVVAAKIGVPKATRRETLAALVDYFRSFTESNDPPSTEHGVYLALALSKKGVCRHRAYAFMVTASGLGLRARVVTNEAHAWVEVNDGRRWKRVDLGGAGSILAEDKAPLGPTYAPPPDPFKWPPGARRGEDLGRTGQGVNGGEGTGGAGVGGGAGAGASPTTSTSTTGNAGAGLVETAADTRAESSVTLETAEGSITRGDVVHVRGSVVADGAPCGHLPVGISARERKTGAVVPLGEMATDERGAYQGGVLVPKTVLVGDYELVAVTAGDTRCRKAASP
jgi:transglutaminase-like putative cysteine protease